MAYLSDKDLIRLIREITDHADSEKDYSYYELVEYARLNNTEWYDALSHSAKLRGHISSCFNSARRKQRYNGEKPRTLLQSMDKIMEEREKRGEL